MSGTEQKPRGLLGRLFARRSAEPVEPKVEEVRAAHAAPDAPVEQEVEAPESTPEPMSEPVGAAARAAELAVAAGPDAVAVDATAMEPGEAAEATTKKSGWFQRLKSGLAKTSAKLTEGISAVFTKRKLDDATLQELEDLLIQADLGLSTSMRITEALAAGRFNKMISPEEVRQVLAAEVEKVLAPVATPIIIDPQRKPHVILVVGVNGTGKTTTIGKLAHGFRRQGRTVMLAAGDTFRAAAIDQLKIWGERTGAHVEARAVGADAAGLAFDALQKARTAGADVLMIDTAGRLQNKQVLMDELEKVVRVIRKIDATAPHDVLLVLDATTGQNALNQVEVFRDKAGVSGLIMTKLDGTARGGILVAIADKFGLPVHAIGVGEGMEDLQPFDAREFARAIAQG